MSGGMGCDERQQRQAADLNEIASDDRVQALHESICDLAHERCSPHVLRRIRDRPLDRSAVGQQLIGPRKPWTLLV